MLNTENRLYDPRLAQWLTRDPVFQPWESPYSAMAGNPILFSDPQGLDPSKPDGSTYTDKKTGDYYVKEDGLWVQRGNVRAILEVVVYADRIPKGTLERTGDFAYNVVYGLLDATLGEAGRWLTVYGHAGQQIQNTVDGGYNLVVHPKETANKIYDNVANAIDRFQTLDKDTQLSELAHGIGGQLPGLVAGGVGLAGKGLNLTSKLGTFGRGVKKLAGEKWIGKIDDVAGGSGLGDLTQTEINQIQSAVNIAERSIDVVGSAAKGKRKGIGLEIPFEKGIKSDIDHMAPFSSIQYFEGIYLPDIDLSHGIIGGHGNAYIRPFIRFEPYTSPKIFPLKN